MSEQIQDQLDRAGEVVLPNIEYAPDYPLFVPAHTTVIGSRKGRIYSDKSGYGFILGWRRGILGAGHFVSGGFRTNLDSCLMSYGTEWDLGPYNGGWSGMRRVTISFAAVLNYSPTGSWEGLSLCGVVADPHVVDPDDSISGGNYYGPRPAPYCINCENGAIVVRVGVSDGKYLAFKFDTDLTNPVMNIRATIDADLGIVELYKAPLVDRFDNAVQIQSSTPPYGSFTLAENHLWPFHAGRIDPFVMSGGYWGTANVYDATIRHVWVNCERGPAKGWSVGTWCNETDYGDDMPLVRCAGGNTRFLLTPKIGQGIPDGSGQIIMQNVTVRGVSGNPCVLLGCVLNCEFDHFYSIGGTRGISATGLAVNYPMALDRCNFESQSDRALFLHKASWVDIRRSYFSYPRKAAATFLGGSGLVDHCPVIPPGDNYVGQDVIFEQVGGSWTYARVTADYESVARPKAFLTLKPCSLDLAFFPTAARVIDCSPGGVPGDPGEPPLVIVLPACGEYLKPSNGRPPAPITVKLDQSDPRERKVKCFCDTTLFEGAEVLAPEVVE